MIQDTNTPPRITSTLEFLYASRSVVYNKLLMGMSTGVFVASMKAATQGERDPYHLGATFLAATAAGAVLGTLQRNGILNRFFASQAPASRNGTAESRPEEP